MATLILSSAIETESVCQVAYLKAPQEMDQQTIQKMNTVSYNLNARCRWQRRYRIVDVIGDVSEEYGAHGHTNIHKILISQTG